MAAAQDEDNQKKQLNRFIRPTLGTRMTEPDKKRKFFHNFKKKVAGKTIRNAEIDECDEIDNMAEELSEDENDLENLDLCVMGSDKGVCFNCNELGHFSCKCPKPRKKSKGPPRQSKFNKFKRVDNIVKNLRALEVDGRNLLLDALEEEGFC
jgi:hypothetical protein